jgi:hypothetical protein
MNYNSNLFQNLKSMGILRLFQEWGRRGMKQNGGGGEFSNSIL